MSELAQLLAESKGLPAAFRKDHPVGTVWAGKVTKVIVRQQRDDDGNLKSWDNGDRMMEVVIAIQTDQRNPEKPNDDGIRGIYIKFWGEQKKAFQECLDAAGVTDMEIGGMFAAQHVGWGDQPKDAKVSPAKLMKFEYKPPTGLGGLLDGANSSAGNGAQQVSTVTQDPWGPSTPGMAAAAAADQQAAAAQSLLTSELGATPIPATPEVFPAPPATPIPAAAAPPATPLAAVPTDPVALLATIKSFIALNMTDAQITAVTGASEHAVAMIRGLPAPAPTAA